MGTPIDWAAYQTPLFAVDTLDGERVRGLVMRRKNTQGEWEYRRPTPEEEAQYISDEAW